MRGGSIMPATVMHSFFAKDVYDVLPMDIQKRLDPKRCKTFSQSTDSLMFYNLFSILPGKNIRNFQQYFHTHKTQDFFINLLQYIRSNQIDDIDTYSFLVGFICHYVLDSTFHPYVIYRTGNFDKKKHGNFEQFFL